MENIIKILKVPSKKREVSLHNDFAPNSSQKYSTTISLILFCPIKILINPVTEIVELFSK